MDIQVEELLNGYLADKELEIHRVVYKKEGKNWVLRVFLDKPIDSETEYVGVDECEEVAGWLSDKLDELDLIDRQYNLEVSSPGLDRELIKDADYVRFAGRLVEIKTFEAIDGNKKFEGILKGKDGSIVTIEADGSEFQIDEEKISKINLAVVF